MIIYALIDPQSFQIRYIGQTINMKQRLSQHMVKSKKPRTHVQCWINKLLNENLRPEFFILEECHSIDHMNEMEQFYISYFKFIGSNLTNHNDGGNRPQYFVSKPCSKEMKEFMSKNQTERMKDPKIYNSAIKNLKRPDEKTKEKIRQTLLGTKRPPEVIEKMSKALKGRKASPELRKKLSDSKTNKKAVICNETGQIFESIQAAATSINAIRSHVSEHLNHKQYIQTVKGYTFSYYKKAA